MTPPNTPRKDEVRVPDLVERLRTRHSSLVTQSFIMHESAAEIERLRLDLEAKDCLADSQYKAGVKHGWSLCATDDEAGYQCVMARTEHIAELRRIRAARQALKEHSRNAD